MKLTIELVPKSAWFSNVRFVVSRKDWDTLRRESYKKAGYVCEICGGIGKRHPVECHEIWQYDDTNYIQKLMGLISLCPPCHEVKHIGLANVRGRAGIAIGHLAGVNNWSEQQAEEYIRKQFDTWQERSLYAWETDLTWLDEKGIEYQKKEKGA